jgi:hypothetical protein
VYGDFVKMLYLDVDMKPGTDWMLKTNEDETLFIYIVEGEGYFGEDNNNLTESKRAVLFESGDIFKVKSGKSGIRFFLYSAKPLSEEIAWGGPIVMNTKEELNQAFRELENGTFIK